MPDPWLSPGLAGAPPREPGWGCAWETPVWPLTPPPGPDPDPVAAGDGDAMWVAWRDESCSPPRTRWERMRRAGATTWVHDSWHDDPPIGLR